MFADWEIEILKELLPVVRVRMKEIMELGYAVTPLPYLGAT